jgi:hypothetical protein
MEKSELGFFCLKHRYDKTLERDDGIFGTRHFSVRNAYKIRI